MSAVVPATEPRFVILGTGRHGSGYAAAALTAAGWNVGHEQWWNPLLGRTHGLDGDSSWIATVTLDPDYAGAIFHQVRHPLRYVESQAKAPDWGEYRGLKLAGVGQIIDDPIERALAEWVCFNAAAEELAFERWCLDEFDDVAPAIVEHYVGSPTGPPGEAPSKTTNWHGDPVLALEWEDIPLGMWTDAAFSMCERYGL